MEVYMLQFSAGEFKTHCLKLMDLAQKKGETVIITKRGIPVAKLVPFTETPTPIFGFMAGSLEIKDDIILPIDEVWHAEDE
jgi:prevent-host-death family protein